MYVSSPRMCVFCVHYTLYANFVTIQTIGHICLFCLLHTIYSIKNVCVCYSLGKRTPAKSKIKTPQERAADKSDAKLKSAARKKNALTLSRAKLLYRLYIFSTRKKYKNPS